MAHLRDSNGQPLKRGDKFGVIVTEGESRERAKRETKFHQKMETIQTNHNLRAKRSKAEQLIELDFRLGQNVGATRERTRLSKV
jgi:hypothetical protein